MKCPFCEHSNSRVLDSRETEDNTSIRRRRECEACLRRFTTYERYEEITLTVVKKDMKREKFERQKVLHGLQRACEKRPISAGQQEAIISSIERDLRHAGDTEVSSRRIGEMVMQYLKGLDPVAYVRFASVYKDFQDVNRFAEELKNLSPRTVPALPAEPSVPTNSRTAEEPAPNEEAARRRKRRS